MRKFSVTKQAEGWVALDCRGKIISGPHDEEWMAHLYGTHAANAPSLEKRLNLRRIKADNAGGYSTYFKGRPFAGVQVTVSRHDDARDGWYAFGEKDGESFRLDGYATKAAILKEINAWGDDVMQTRNILNPDAGPIDIARRAWGGCTDPGTELYHSM